MEGKSLKAKRTMFTLKGKGKEDEGDEETLGIINIIVGGSEPIRGIRAKGKKRFARKLRLW